MHSKLILNFALGCRDQATTDAFIEGLRAVTAPKRFQITTDGFPAYKSAITTTLSDRCDYSILTKVYAEAPEAGGRYSPAEVTHTQKQVIMGDPEPSKVCNADVPSHAVDELSEKWDNLWSAYCLFFAHCNFCRIHKSLWITPAMAAGITGQIWDLENLISPL